MTTQVHPNGATAPVQFSEAPASATIRVTSPSGLEWMLTTRAATMRDLISQVTGLEQWLVSNQWQAAPSGKPSKATATTGDAPACPTHGPMKRGKHGWYCPHKLLDDDGAGRPAYCKYTAK